MNDKTLFIIISVINVLMWLVVVKHMTAANKHFNELHKSDVELQKKQSEYMHTVHESINEMTKMNITAMGTFITELTTFFEKHGAQIDAQDNRE